MSVFLQFCSEKICRRTCNILLRYDRSGKSQRQCVQVWEIGCPEGLRTFATINMCSSSERYTTSVPRKTSCRRTRRSEWRRREMNYFRYVPSHFQMELTIMFFDILGEAVINWGVKDAPNFHFGSASPRIHAWTWILYFFIPSFSLFFLSSKRSDATLMRIKGFSGRIRCVVICRRLIEKHTHSALSAIPLFARKWKLM